MIYSSALKTCDEDCYIWQIGNSLFCIQLYYVDGIVGNDEITHYQQFSFLLNDFRSQKHLYEEKVVYLLPKINIYAFKNSAISIFGNILKIGRNILFANFE